MDVFYEEAVMCFYLMREIRWTTLEVFLACRLIPLDKNPGLMPKGIGEVLRRIAVKAVIRTLRKIAWFHLISWCGNFLERHSFRIVSGDSPKTMRKLYLSTKSPHQEIRWSHGIFRSEIVKKDVIKVAGCLQLFTE